MAKKLNRKPIKTNEHSAYSGPSIHVVNIMATSIVIKDIHSD